MYHNFSFSRNITIFFKKNLILVSTRFFAKIYDETSDSSTSRTKRLIDGGTKERQETKRKKSPADSECMCIYTNYIMIVFMNYYL